MNHALFKGSGYDLFNYVEDGRQERATCVDVLSQLFWMAYYLIELIITALAIDFDS